MKKQARRGWWRDRRNREVGTAVAILLVLAGVAGYMAINGPISSAGFLAGSAYAKGDVNGDGTVNVSDAKLVIGYVGGAGSLTARQRVAADLNGDGKVNVSDAVSILRTSHTLGDLDDNGSVAQADYELLVKICAGQVQPSEYQRAVADLNGDGAVNVRDAVLLSHKLDVPGDIDGDGRRSYKDLDLAISLLVHSGGIEPTDFQRIVGDVTEDGVFNVSDTTKLLRDLRQVGDIDGDGKLTAADPDILMEIIVGKVTPTGAQKALADVNGDGAVDVRDASALQKRLAAAQ